MRISDAIAKLARVVRVEPPRTIGYCDPAILIRDADLSFLMRPNAAPAKSCDDGEKDMNRLAPTDCSPDCSSPSRPPTSPSV